MAKQTFRESASRAVSQLLAILASGENPDGTRFKLETEEYGENATVFTGTYAFANSEAAGTVKAVDVPLVAPIQRQARYLVVVTNPGASALTVRPAVRETLGAAPGTQRFPDLPAFAVPANSPDGVARVVEGFMLGEAARLKISNDAAIALAGGFTGEVRVRRI